VRDAAELDSIDWQILEELQNDATLQNRVLASRVGLAPSSCLQRVRRLRELGVITGFHAVVDPRTTGLSLEAIVSVSVRPHTRPVVAAFRQFLMAQPETRSIFHVSGQSDFLVHIAVIDSTHLQSFIMDKVAARTEVRNLASSVILERVETRALTPPATVRAPRRRATP
jgi:DNA-binding Lrp family transcriptional regulator